MRKKPKEPIFGCLLSSFTKSNQRKRTHCGEEIIKQGKPVCRLESIKELLEEEVVNCTTSLEREELNKWSHDQDKNEGEIQQTGGQKAASCQGNSCSLADDMLNYFFEMMHTSPPPRFHCLLVLIIRFSPSHRRLFAWLRSQSRLQVQIEQAISFHSTPCYANRTSKRLHRTCTPAGVSPLLSVSRGLSPYNEPEISALGTPVLFSQMSTSSL